MGPVCGGVLLLVDPLELGDQVQPHHQLCDLVRVGVRTQLALLLGLHDLPAQDLHHLQAGGKEVTIFTGIEVGNLAA